MKKIFFDLDGTLIDSRQRLYRLFQDLIPASTFTFDAYWDLKRHKVNHQMILAQHFPNEDFEAFNQKWLTLIETPKYLDMDTLYPNVQETLEKLKQNHELYVLTARQDKEALAAELNRLGIRPFFKDVLATEGKHSKEDLLKKLPLSTEDVLVGDTGYDIRAGQSCGLDTVAVSYGFLAPEVLKTYEPNRIIDSITKI